MKQSYPHINKEDIIRILRMRFDNTFLSLKDLPDPSLFKDMDKAIDRILHAIKHKEQILLIGDYDVDGIVSVSIVRDFFKRINFPLQWLIPDRFQDGYGFSPKLFSRIGDIDLIITVDNGIAAHEAAQKCQKENIDLIVTDHHIVPNTLPYANAIINQKQPECSFPYKEICGAQIAWYLCAALNRELKTEIDMKTYLGEVALAIIADIMPLHDINRLMVQYGLKLLNKSNKPFISVYREITKKDRFKAEDIAFGIVPMMNSAGRVADASIASDFICSKTIREARVISERLRFFNDRRKYYENEVFKEAVNNITAEDPIIIVFGDNWHEGVLGIVASRLAQQYEKSALVMTRCGDFYKGSGRSFGNCDLFSLINTQKDHLEKFGGHKLAVGFSLSVDNLFLFKENLLKKASSLCDRQSYSDNEIVGELYIDEIGWELYRAIEKFEPFGYGNPRPKFVSRNLEIVSIYYLGLEKKHRIISFRKGENIIEGIEFFFKSTFHPGDKVNIVYKINENNFKGRSILQLNIEKIKLL